MTNYDEILDKIRQEQGYVSGKQEKEAVIGTAEKVLEQYRNEFEITTVLNALIV
jgi:hypothetical protein